MTGLVVEPRALPPIGQRRCVSVVRTGWHIELPDGVWRLVTGVGLLGGGEVLLSVSVGLHDEDCLEYGRAVFLMTRTPEEQIRFIEAQRLERAAGPGLRGVGPVSRIHYQGEISAALRASRDIVGRAPCVGEAG